MPSEEHLAAQAAEQLVEWVDADGTVRAIVTRAEMRDRGLRHRSVYVVVQSPADEILLHRRADWKDVFPGAWDLAFGGVCDPGETWQEAAGRELFEEAGVDFGDTSETNDPDGTDESAQPSMTDLGPVAWEAPGVALIGRVFTVVTTGPFVFNDGEVTATQWVPREVVAEHVAALTIPTDSLDLVLPLLTSPGFPRPADRAGN